LRFCQNGLNHLKLIWTLIRQKASSHFNGWT
jgi:hypothetical protein